MYINSTSLIGKSNCMEATHKAQKVDLPKYSKTTIGGKSTYQIYQGPHKLEKAWVSFQGDAKNMLILENGEKLNGGQVGKKSS